MLFIAKSSLITVMAMCLWILSSLVACSAKPKLTSSNSSSESFPLVFAARDGNSRQVKELLEKGVDVDVKDNQGWTAYAAASTNGHLEVMKMLKQAGAKSTIDLK